MTMMTKRSIMPNYLKQKQCAHSYISSYTDTKVRERYSWVEKKLEEMRRDALLEKGILLDISAFDENKRIDFWNCRRH